MLAYLNKIKLLYVFILFISLVNCANIIENKKFDQVSKDFLNHYFQFYPVEATLMGNHDYDHRLNNLGEENVEKLLRFLKSTAKKIAAIDTSKLSNKNKINYQILSFQLKLHLFDLEQRRRWQNDANYYTELIYDAIDGLKFHTRDTTENLTRNLISRLDQVPNLLVQAKKNLMPNDIMNINTAIEHIDNQKRIIAFQLPDNFKVTSFLIDTLNKKTETVVDSLDSFRKFLESKIKAPVDRALAMSSETYQDYVNLICDEKITLGDLVNLLEVDYQKYYDALGNAINRISSEPKHSKQPTSNANSIERINDEVEKQSLNKDEIISYCQENVNNIKRYIDEIWNISLPIDYNVQIDWINDDRAIGPNLAYFEKPGLLEPTPQFYCFLKPISNDRDWIQQLSQLRYYNKPAVKVAMLIQANPIHYQVWIKKLEKLPILARAFPDQNFLNAWQYYFVFAMLEAGFEGYDPELQYVFLKNYLKTLLLAKAEIQFYLQKLTHQQLEQFLLDSNMFKKNEVAEAYKQINCSPGYALSICWGVKQFKELEQACRAEVGPHFSQKEYFHLLLNQGPIAIKVLKLELMNHFFSSTTIK